MKISTKGRYGLIALLDLAINSSEGQVSLNSIAARRNISVRYLEQMFSSLRNAGIVKSVKGSQGGYILSGDPSRIKVGEILRALEGDLSVVDNDAKVKDSSRAIEYCIQLNVWDKLNDSVNSVVDSVTLDYLIQETKKLKSELSAMFYI